MLIVIKMFQHSTNRRRKGIHAPRQHLTTSVASPKVYETDDEAWGSGSGPYFCTLYFGRFRLRPTPIAISKGKQLTRQVEKPLISRYFCTYRMVKVSTLLFPPLVQPRSPEFPLGVSAITDTVPGAEITSVESFTLNCLGLTTVAESGVELMTASVDETN